jgi:hypothetical protein
MRKHTHRQDSLGRALRNAVLTSVGMVGFVMAGYGLGTYAVDAGLLPQVAVVDESAPPAEVTTPSQLRIDRARQLVATHDCWTGGDDMPADMLGQFPGHVVVTPLPTRGEPHPRPTYSADLVGPALDHVFGTDPAPGPVVHAFCR